MPLMNLKTHLSKSEQNEVRIHAKGPCGIKGISSKYRVVANSCKPSGNHEFPTHLDYRIAVGTTRVYIGTYMENLDPQE